MLDEDEDEEAGGIVELGFMGCALLGVLLLLEVFLVLEEATMTPGVS
jgi:hypothetical protein